MLYGFRLLGLSAAVLASVAVHGADAATVLRIETPAQFHDSFTPANRVGGESAPVLTSWGWNRGFIVSWLNYRSATDRRGFVGFYSSSGYQTYPGPRQLGAASGPTSGTPAVSAGPVAFADGTSLALFSADRRAAAASAKRDIFAQRFTGGSIEPVGNPVGVNQIREDVQDALLVARLSNNNAVVAFVRHASQASSFDIKGRVLNPTGGAVTGEKALVVNTAGAQRPTSLAALTNGGAVLAYTVKEGQTQRVLAQRLGAGANRIGDPATLKTTTGTATYGAVGVVGLSGGRFLALWFVAGASGNATLKGRIFSSTGVGGNFLTIGTTRIQTTAPTPPKIAVLPDGQIGVVTGAFKAGKHVVEAWLLNANAGRVLGPVKLAESASKLTPESLIVFNTDDFLASWTQDASQPTATKAMGVRFYIINCGRC